MSLAILRVLLVRASKSLPLTRTSQSEALTAAAGTPQGHDAHQLARPNFSFVPVLRRSNPGCTISLLTDQATQFVGLPAGVQVFRTQIDKARMGRNAWANYYQFRAQQVPALTVHLTVHLTIHLTVHLGRSLPYACWGPLLC